MSQKSLLCDKDHYYFIKLSDFAISEKEKLYILYEHKTNRRNYYE